MPDWQPSISPLLKASELILPFQRNSSYEGLQHKYGVTQVIAAPAPVHDSMGVQRQDDPHHS